MTSFTGQSISVVIPTKNRAQDLRNALDSILLQTRLPDEIVIVDQSSSRQDLNTSPVPLVYVYNPGLSGLCAARNVGAKAVSGEIVLYLDDDVILEPEFIQELLALYTSNVTGVSGIITNYTPPPFSRNLWDTVFMRRGFHDDRQPVYYNANKLGDLRPVRVRQFGGGLMSFRRETVLATGFDEILTGACPGEDIEFCAALPGDPLLLIAPKARLVHLQTPTARAQRHWLSLHAQVMYYMRGRHWHRGLADSLAFAWLNIGYVLVASAASLRRFSLEPFRALIDGAQKGQNLARNPRICGIKTVPDSEGKAAHP